MFHMVSQEKQIEQQNQHRDEFLLVIAISN